MTVYIFFKRNNQRFTKIKNVNDIKETTDMFILSHDNTVTNVPKKSFKIVVYGR
jgi:hypothetical protein